MSDGRTLVEIEQDLEADEAPSDWLRWARFRGTRDAILADAVEPTRHTRRELPIEPIGRRMRGTQDYASLHLGRGTKWIKPRSTST